MAESKAAGDLMAQAYHRTYGMPTLITRSSNNYGPRQYPEKLITFVSDRPGHDRRYALDATKVHSTLGWSSQAPFEQQLQHCLTW